MHQLILLRHAKAIPEGRGADHDRVLTETGRAAAMAIGRTMKSTGLAPEVVLVSTAARTQNTLAQLEAAGVWDEWPNIDDLPALYMANAAQLHDIVRDLPETARSVLIIGHNPGLHDFALSLAGTSTSKSAYTRLDEGFPTAALVEFTITAPWHRLGAGNAVLQRYVAPQDLV